MESGRLETLLESDKAGSSLLLTIKTSALFSKATNICTGVIVADAMTLSVVFSEMGLAAISRQLIPVIIFPEIFLIVKLTSAYSVPSKKYFLSPVNTDP